jgi:hypothetical protein
MIAGEVVAEEEDGGLLVSLLADHDLPVPLRGRNHQRRESLGAERFSQ